MYIEFKLPHDTSSAASIHHVLSRNLLRWGERYSVSYNKKTIKHTVKVTFDDDALYDFFALTWRPVEEEFRDYLTNHTFIEPMKRV